MTKVYADLLIRELGSRGIRAEIWQDAGASVYLRFDDARLGSVRLSNHEGRERYEYRWNLRTDISEVMISRLDGKVQYFFPIHCVTVAATEIKKLKDSLVGDPTRYSYTREDKARDEARINQQKKSKKP